MSRRYRGQRIIANERYIRNLRNGLIGHWTGYGSGLTIKDQSGYNKTGTLTGGTAWTINRNGKRTALSFDGTDDYVSCGSILTGVSDWTISLWVYTRSSAPTIQYPIGFHTNHGIFVEYSTDSDKWGVTVNGAVVEGSNLDENKWYHLAVQKSGTTYTIYKDGVYENAGTLLDVELNNFIMGVRADGFWYYNGIIDDTRVWNRALSQSEIYQLYLDNNYIDYKEAVRELPNEVETVYYGRSFTSRVKGQRVFGYEQLDNQLKAGLMAHFIGGGSGLTWKNITGYGYDASFVNTPTWGLNKTGERSSLDFSGSSNHLLLPTVTANTWISDDVTGSLSLWFKTSSSAQQTLISQTRTTSNEQLQTVGFLTDGTIYAQAYYGGGYNHVMKTTNSFNNGQWHHMVITGDSVDWRIWVDGKEETLSIVTGSNIGYWFNNLGVSINCQYRIGYLNSTYPYPMIGSIDNIRIYNRLISESEIQKLYRYDNVQPASKRSYMTVVSSGNIKTRNGVTWANVKSINGVLEANIKTLDGVTN